MTKNKELDYRLLTVALVLLGIFTFTRFFEIRPKGTALLAGVIGQDLSVEEKEAVQAFLKFKKIKGEVIPAGVPDVYGRELGVSFDEVQESMDRMRGLGPTYGVEGKRIVLEGEELERFIAIGKQTSCEHCCDATTLVDDEGVAACGCAHSIVMRGLVAYLIKNHSDKFTDDEILAEVNRWKRVFFPKQILTARFDELRESGDKDVESLLREFPDFLPQMVGGC